jgi:ParB family chromosome partitioning protein
MGHGRAMINIENQMEQLEIYEKIISQKLSVRATEALVKNPSNASSSKSQANAEQVYIPKPIKKGIKEFSEYFGHKIDVKLTKNGSGKITIPFHSQEDFNRITKLIKRAK